MPEHRPGTPIGLRDLESFLWWDLEAVATWAAWLDRRGYDASAAEASFAEAVDVQRALRALQAGNGGVPDEDDLTAARERINASIERHGLFPRITADGIRVAPAPGDAIGRILGLAVDAMAAALWTRFKLCRDETCRASFYDASRSGTKTWCSMELCGSRSKMRRLRARA